MVKQQNSSPVYPFLPIYENQPMKTRFPVRGLKDISISTKLYFIVGAMAVLIVLELFTLWFAVHTLSSVRALVGAEGLWSKAQKDAVYQLEKYYRTQNDTDYQAFKKYMSVPQGDHIARLELLKPNPDFSIAHQGFLQGRVHENDIDGILNFLVRFHKIEYVNRAIQFWAEGDSTISQLAIIGESLHNEITGAASQTAKRSSLIEELEPLNQKLTELEDGFSYSLGEGSRWLEDLILKLLFIVALTVEITGLLLTYSVSRGISRGLQEINRATDKIKAGDLTARAQVFSHDEIGQLARAMNQMTEKLTVSNRELEQFAYVASHDLQEPLRTITNYVGLFEKQYRIRLDSTATSYIDLINAATGRMQLLIKDLLDYCRIGIDKKTEKTDCNALVEDILVLLEKIIQETGCKVHVDKLPVIYAYPEIFSLFQNLISNAIKFRRANGPALIWIAAEPTEDGWLFRVEDNGIGIEKAYLERIFIIFQKLHSKNEYRGSGIGLALCKKIVELHGGKIWVESELEKGSSFRFTIPNQA